MPEPHLFLYKAFISHCDADREVGDWLARSLQHYRLGRSIVGRETHAGRIPRTIGPIFTRRADDGLRPLSTNVVNALFGSQFLIVIVSHNYPRREQVNKEIKLFKSYHGESRILYLQMDDAAESCFPAAALFHVDADGTLTGREAHPGQIVKCAVRSDPVLQRVVAYLLGMSIEELAAARERDLWTARVKWGVGGAFLLILCVRFLGSIDYSDFSRRAEPPTDSSSSRPENDAPRPEGSLPIFASKPDFLPLDPMDLAGSFSPSSQKTAGFRSPSFENVSSSRSRRTKTRGHDRARRAH